eukprot:TRINITY_DN9643_c0_g3_i1.p1 TRINITY_DN9643_c0_g3~~TRINITY_DN9643_c0_g3_i1.p1  ORF type:complete len:164 (+),score=21.47 TRINITY_DN9643_c0_g3_i1:73-564(+)
MDSGPAATDSHQGCAPGERWSAPVAEDVPLPRFVREASAGSATNPTRNTRTGIRELSSAHPTELRQFLQEVAGLLMAVPGRTMTLSHLGTRLRQSTVKWLQSHRPGLANLLSAFHNDFLVGGQGGGQSWVIYLHEDLQADFVLEPAPSAVHFEELQAATTITL